MPLISSLLEFGNRLDIIWLENEAIYALVEEVVNRLKEKKLFFNQVHLPQKTENFSQTIDFCICKTNTNYGFTQLETHSK